MNRFVFRRSPKYRCQISVTRHFHRITTDFSNYNARGELVTRKIPIIIGDPGEAYVLIYPEVGNALSAASPASSAASIDDKCKLTFFHNPGFFGFDLSGYPRLYVPRGIPRQTTSEASPATLFLSGKMHEITLDGTPDEEFANHAHSTYRDMASVLDQLEDM